VGRHRCLHDGASETRRKSVTIFYASPITYP
jgi:hypothetical protein